jgi:very-short-patch-repair endonuclease
VRGTQRSPTFLIGRPVEKLPWNPESVPGQPDRRRQLRRDSTDAERALWRLLRGRQLLWAKFRRQYQIGPYILDVFCFHHKLAVELDGSQHYSADGMAHDAIRSQFLATKGVRVLRFSDRAVLTERRAVVEVILRELDGPSP